MPQAPDRAATWSKRQQPKYLAITGPRFANVDISAQPNPKAAIEMIKEAPIVMVETRTAACDGDGPLGHPRVFLNLDKSGHPMSCMYCGRKFLQKSHDHD